MTGDSGGDNGENANAFASLRALAKGGSVLFAGLVLELGISFLATLIIARVLGRVGFGAVSLGRTTMTILSTVLLVGLDTGVGRYLPRDDDPAYRRGVLVSALQIALPLSIAAGVGLYLAAPLLARVVFDDASVSAILRVFAVAIPFVSLMKLAIGGVQGTKRAFPKVVVRNLTQPLIRFLGIAVALWVGLGVVGVAWAYALAYVIAALVGVFFLRRLTPLFSRVEAVPIRRELLAFSAPLALTMAMSILLSDLDTFMLGAFKPTGAVGIYNVVYPLGELLVVALSSFAFVFMPVLSELDAEGATGEMRRVYRVIAKWIFVATFPVFVLFALFPEVVIGLTFGPQYTSGALALSVLTVGFFVHATAGLNSNALTALGRTRVVMYDNVSVVALNAVLNLVLIPRYSVLGAAVTTTISYIVLNVLYSVQLYGETGIQPLGTATLRPGAVAVVPAAGLYLLAGALGRTIPVVLGLFGCFLVCYGVAVLRFGGIEDEERRLLASFEERVGVDLEALKAVASRLIG